MRARGTQLTVNVIISSIGVRNIDYMMSPSNGQPRTMSIGNSICNDGVHCLGNVYSEAIWSLYKRTLRAAPFFYDENTSLEIVTRLTFIAGKYTNIIMLVSNPF